MPAPDRRGGGRAAPWVDHLESVMRTGEMARLVGRANAGPRAHVGGGPLGIDQVRRCIAAERLTGLGADITVSGISFAALSTPLRAEVVLTGRPITVEVSGVYNAGTSGVLSLDVLLRGVSMSGATNGVAYTQSTAPGSFHGSERDMAPTPGPATIEVVARRETANGVIYANAGNRVLLLVTEE